MVGRAEHMFSRLQDSRVLAAELRWTNIELKKRKQEGAVGREEIGEMVKGGSSRLA